MNAGDDAPGSGEGRGSPEAVSPPPPHTCLTEAASTLSSSFEAEVARVCLSIREESAQHRA